MEQSYLEPSDDEKLDLFIEQAEYIPRNLFEEWTVHHLHERSIVNKLKQSGAKLLVGPRGCGKTTLMLKAYYAAKENNTLGIYVNYKSSLKLEPLYKQGSTAHFWFNQWLLHKIAIGIFTTINDNYKDNEILLEVINECLNLEELNEFINAIEIGSVKNSQLENITIEKIIETIEKCLDILKINRCIILLDDAAHAFSNQQQQDFFELFKKLRRKNISPKAAVYPGVTKYSLNFHIGHDAEEINVWLTPNNQEYINFMHNILMSRFTGVQYGLLCEDRNLIDLICYASYGIPRNLLNIISSLFLEDKSGIDASKLNIKHVHKVIKNSFEQTFEIYKSLKYKLPIYSNFVESGLKIYEILLEIVKQYNKNSQKIPTSVIGIAQPLPSELSKIFEFFQYSGLIVNISESSRGTKATYEIFQLSATAIISKNVFFSERTFSKDKYCLAFEHNQLRTYPRYLYSTILEKAEISLENNMGLALPTCNACGAPRISAEAKFCSQCGARLSESSVFESIVNQDIEVLPLTRNRVRSIKAQSKIRKIKDILLDHDNSELMKVDMVGSFWCNRIKSYAEEVIS
jgi:ABC-type branched-subunit amino acid transport system ATPase component